ncbi:MAG TPA: peptide chain release factor-like protein [Phycisphaerales bacterium]|nr:peptide chain release factor-like protein [Phycisphaerales bacterium]
MKHHRNKKFSGEKHGEGTSRAAKGGSAKRDGGERRVNQFGGAADPGGAEQARQFKADMEVLFGKQKRKKDAKYAHPAALDPEVLLKNCTVDFGRSGGGPGGQHRNKVETGVTLMHTPTGISGHADERRKQFENRQVALRRLRLKLAIGHREFVHPKFHQQSELWARRRQGEKMSVNPAHADYPSLLAEALDVIVARKFDVAGAAGVLGVTMSQLAKLVRHEKQAMVMVNKGREERGLPGLK